MGQLVHKVFLIGQLGKDPKITFFDNGSIKASILVTTQNHYQSEIGRWIQSTQWHRLIAWGRTAELVMQMLHKGTFVKLGCSLRQHRVDLLDGGSRLYQVIVLDQFDLLLDQSDRSEVGKRA